MYVSSTLPEIKSKYIDTGKVYYVFKDFPVVSNHPQAALAAQAAECAGDQNSYWQMHEALFDEPSEWDTTPEAAKEAFYRYADTLKLDADTLMRCVEQGYHADEVERDNQEAIRLGLTGTPAFIVNGRLMSGARPTEQFIQVFDRELSQR
ncbi:MAG TPA: DsbA family protein [Herpetosiphonaceae bacterium]